MILCKQGLVAGLKTDTSSHVARVCDVFPAAALFSGLVFILQEEPSNGSQ